jgi:hypothetical protein
VSHERASQESKPDRHPRSERSPRPEADPSKSALSLLGLHDALGNRGVLRLLQTKLAVSQPGDPYEQEANRMAQRVVPSGSSNSAAGPFSDDSAGSPPSIQRRPAPPTGSLESGTIENLLGAIGPGEPLDAGSRSFFESRLGRDFGDVQVHT